MRRRLIIAVLSSAIALSLALAPPAFAQESGGEGGGELGSDDRYADGELLGDSSGAEVVAEDGSDLGDPTAARAGGGDVTCRWLEMDLESESAGGPLDWSLLTDPPPEWVGQQVSVMRICDDGGTYGVAEIVTFTLPVAGPPTVDPRELALLARRRLPFALPEVSFAPPLESAEDFLLVQFPTWIYVTNWDTQSRSATAGGVTATVTARPVRQVWDFDPRTADPELEGGCESAGVAYDPARPPEVQSTPCSFTFRHTSVGQPHPYPDAYEAHLTVIYEITWTSNIGVGGSLGTVPRTTVVPVRVGEQQALNESGGTNQ